MSGDIFGINFGLVGSYFSGDGDEIRAMSEQKGPSRNRDE